MDFTSLVPPWLDALLIAPFRWPAEPHAGLWLGAGCLAGLCLLLGELTSSLLFWLQRRRLLAMQDNLLHYHNLSVDALHAGDKTAYLAANKLAHEDFGRNYFAQAAVGMSGLWPLPFALAWMSLRFEGITLYHIPGTDMHASYVFVLLSCYLLFHLIFARCRKHLPFFSYIEGIKRQARERRGTARHF